MASGNAALREGDAARAIQCYLSAALSISDDQASPGWFSLLESNLVLARRAYMRQRRAAIADGGEVRVGVCGWELAHNAAGRVIALADAYRRISPAVGIVGAIFPRWGRQPWPPMATMANSCNFVVVEDEAGFIRQAVGLVMHHPYDLVHLSKPRFPNLVFGALYELVWGARVVWDIDDEEMGFFQSRETAVTDGEVSPPPVLKGLHGQAWTRFSISHIGRFGAVTVSNPALQARYGGELLPHVRDEVRFAPRAGVRSAQRLRFGIPEHVKVVLFFGTPRRHKGLLEVARAIAELGREDVWFVIVGDFADDDLRSRLLAVSGVNYLFIEGQPYEHASKIVAVGDYVVLLQDSDSLVSKYQLPAKLVDALAMGLLVFAKVTPAIAWLAEVGAVVSVEPETLSETLSEQLASEEEVTQRVHNRKIFLEKLSQKAYLPVIRRLLDSPMQSPAPEWGGQLHDLRNGGISWLGSASSGKP